VRVLIIDADHCGLDFAMRCAACDHEVRLFRYSKKPTRYAEGFKGITLVDDYKPSMAWAKDGLIFVTSNNRYIWELDRYRQDFGYKIFGPSVASAKLEIERSAGMEAMRAVGVEVPPFETFDSLEAADAFVRKSDVAWVHKPLGSEEQKDLTYVSKDPADMSAWLRRQIARGYKLKGKAMLQQKVDRLAELGVSGWMGPDGFLPDRFQIAFEHKNLMNDEKGPATGEMGTVCQYVETDKLAKEMLLPLEPILRTLGHRGDFAIGAMIDTAGRAHFLEFTARCGYPAWWIQVASHRGDPAKWMRDLLDGKDSLKVSFDPAIGVVMAQPDFPHDNAPPEVTEGVPIRGVDEALPDLHLVEVMMGKGPIMESGKVVDRPTYETAGTYVCVATGLGKTVEKARAKVYGVVDRVHFPNRMFRTDIGEKVIAALPALKKHGYALDMTP
jgi:phosphoribosylamine-glycine ligase